MLVLLLGCVGGPTPGLKKYIPLCIPPPPPLYTDEIRLVVYNKTTISQKKRTIYYMSVDIVNLCR